MAIVHVSLTDPDLGTKQNERQPTNQPIDRPTARPNPWALSGIIKKKEIEIERYREREERLCPPSRPVSCLDLIEVAWPGPAFKSRTRA